MQRDARRWFEIGAVITTGICKFIFVDMFPAKFWFILFTCIFWSAYVLFRYAKDASTLRHWGFGGGEFSRAFMKLLPFAVVCTGLFLITGLAGDTIVFSWNLIPALLLYPVWGTIQQFLIIGLIAGNLQDLRNRHVPRVVIVLLTATVFAIVHYPSGYLIAGTFVLATVYTPVYLAHRDVVAPGLYHGWLGAFFYYFVLGRDAWAEMIGTI